MCMWSMKDEWGGGGCCVYVEYEGMKGEEGGVVCMWCMKG